METYYEKYKRRIGELDTMRQDLDAREKEIVSEFITEREQFRAGEGSPAISPFDYPEDEIVKSLIGSKPPVRMTQSSFRKKHVETDNA